MLILGRKYNEKIRVGDDIVITVLNTEGTSIHIGIDAPQNIPIHREEVYQKIQKEKK